MRFDMCRSQYSKAMVRNNATICVSRPMTARCDASANRVRSTMPREQRASCEESVNKRFDSAAIVFAGLCLIVITVEAFLFHAASLTLTDSLTAISSQEISK